MIEIQALYKRNALKDINLSVKKGTLSLLRGKSGSGKTTLLSIIAGITKPTSGEVRVNGENICSYNDYFASSYREKRVGFITQEFYLFDALSLQENIAMALAHSTLSTEEIERRVLSLAKKLHISHKMKASISTLSGGEKQRCIIARALINNPDIILCDEPTASLDSESSKLFIAMLLELKEMQKTIIVATHDPLFEQLLEIDNSFDIKDGHIE